MILPRGWQCSKTLRLGPVFAASCPIGGAIAPAATVLCKCKQEAAPKLIDTAFMDVVIASMKGKPLDAKYYDQYNDYIARSNQICKPDYM